MSRRLLVLSTSAALGFFLSWSLYQNINNETATLPTSKSFLLTYGKGGSLDSLVFLDEELRIGSGPHYLFSSDRQPTILEGPMTVEPNDVQSMLTSSNTPEIRYYSNVELHKLKERCTSATQLDFMRTQILVADHMFRTQATGISVYVDRQTIIQDLSHTPLVDSIFILVSMYPDDVEAKERVFAKMSKLGLVQQGSTNVYFVDVSSVRKLGLHTRFGETAMIFVQIRTQAAQLAHEFGHAFSLRHVVWDPCVGDCHSFMCNGFNPRITEGQAFAMYYNSSSMNRMGESNCDETTISTINCPSQVGDCPSSELIPVMLEVPFDSWDALLSYSHTLSLADTSFIDLSRLFTGLPSFQVQGFDDDLITYTSQKVAPLGAALKSISTEQIQADWLQSVDAVQPCLLEITQEYLSNLITHYQILSNSLVER